jgi:hypothetical protein
MVYAWIIDSACLLWDVECERDAGDIAGHDAYFGDDTRTCLLYGERRLSLLSFPLYFGAFVSLVRVNAHVTLLVNVVEGAHKVSRSAKRFSYISSCILHTLFTDALDSRILLGVASIVPKIMSCICYYFAWRWHLPIDEHEQEHEDAGDIDVHVDGAEALLPGSANASATPSPSSQLSHSSPLSATELLEMGKAAAWRLT